MENDLAHVYWIGGSPCSGKSSVAELLAERYGLYYYNCDDAFPRHQVQASPELHPAFYRISQMGCEELWMRPVAAQIETEIALYREEFGLILADIRPFPPHKPILVEGAALLLELVAPLLKRVNQAVWIVPTPGFQRETYRKRPWVHDVLQDCADAEAAFDNWMARDVGFGQWVARETAVFNLTLLTTDGSRSIPETADLVAQHFSFA